jgi:hypothetical protein
MLDHVSVTVAELDRQSGSTMRRWREPEGSCRFILAGGAADAVPGWHWCSKAPERAAVEAVCHHLK